MSCCLRPSIIVPARSPTFLEVQRNVTIQDVRNTLYPQAQVGSQSQNYQMRIATSGAPSWIFLPPDIKIIEFDIVDIVANYPNFPIGKGRGLFDAQNGKTILCLGRWCRETLIHETLHSLSFTSVRQDLKRSLLNFFEGLTEFFAGYVMFRVYPECYLAWKEERYSHCSVTYVPFVRLWAAFCRFIPISELTKVYFWDGTRNWESRYSGLLDAIHSAGYPRFDDFVRRRIPTVEAKLLDECLKNFGRNRFRTIYEGPLGDTLNFGQMLCPSYPLIA